MTRQDPKEQAVNGYKIQSRESYQTKIHCKREKKIKCTKDKG
jgi:hypothetical protein